MAHGGSRSCVLTPFQNHFAVGSVHKPMSLLLRICEGSSVKHSISDADIALALNFDVNDFSDNIFMSDGWSLNSLGAELCLHLARRLKPGEIVREELVKKGIQLSSIADTRVKASNGMIKHILAYDAHRDVYLDLLSLAGLDAKTPRKSVHEIGGETWRSVSRRNRISEVNSLKNSGTERDIVNRLILKEEPPAGSGRQTIGSSSGETNTDSLEKKRQRKTTMISQRLFFKDSSSARSSASGFSHGSGGSKDDLAKAAQRFSRISLPSVEESNDDVETISTLH
jgi:hypothetical protein